MKIDYINEYRSVLILKNYCENTVNCYCGIVLNFISFFKVSPERINEQQIIEYVLKYNNSNTKAQIIGALKLFYRLIVRQPLKFKYIPYPRKEYHQPKILSADEMKQLIKASESNLKHFCIINMLYSTGIRISELINLELKDIDRANMVLWIKNAKGNKDRSVPLSPKMLDIIIKYYRKYKPVGYLFNGQNIIKTGEMQYSETSVRQFLKKYATLAKINKYIHPHLIRHCFITHLIESGIDCSIVQRIAGHKNFNTTNRYNHLSTFLISRVRTPID